MAYMKDSTGRRLDSFEVQRRSRAWTPFTVSHSGSQRAILGAQDRAAEYDAATNKTFISFLNRSRSLTVREFDHDKARFSPERTIVDYPTSIPMYDDHGVPSLTVTDDGYINIIFGGHGTAATFCRSTSPGTTANGFTNLAVNNLAGTYHTLATDGTNLFTLYRAGAAHGAVFPSHEFGAVGKSTDNGATWTVTPIVDCNAYSPSGTDAAKDFYLGCFDPHPNGRFAFSWCVAHGATHDQNRADMFHAHYDPTNGHVYTVSGTDLGTSIDTRAKFDSCLVRTAANTQTPRQAISPSGKVLITWTEQASDTKIATMCATYRGGAWRVTDLGTRTRHLFSMGAARWDDDDNRFEVFAGVGRASETPIVASVSEAITYGGIGCDFKVFTSADAETFTDRGLAIESSQVQGVGINAISVPRYAARELKALAQPGAVGNATATAPNNGSLIGSGLPFYALTDYIVDPVLVSSNSLGPIDMVISAYPAKATAAVGAFSASTWYQQGIGSVIPPNTTHALVRVILYGTGVAGRAEMRLRPYKSEMPFYELIDIDGAQSSSSANAWSRMVWVPLNYRSFEFFWNGNLAGFGFDVVALRVDGPVCASG